MIYIYYNRLYKNESLYLFSVYYHINNKALTKHRNGGINMNKKLNYLILLTILIFVLIGCEKEETIIFDTLTEKNFNKVDPDKINHYNIEVKLDEEQMTYTGKQWTTYINNTDRTLGELYFHIYPNAFKTKENAPILFGKDGGDTSQYIGGNIDINKVTVDNLELDYSIEGEDNTILHIKLKEPLLKNQKLKIYMEYNVKLPTAKERFGYGDRTINLGNWYPIACVYDEKGWNLEPYYTLGDPFYSDIGNYDVKIHTHKDTVVASSGNILSEKVEGDEKTYEIEGKLIRDFAWVASKDFKIARGKIENTQIKLYYLDENPSLVKKSIKIGEDSIRIFNRIFGDYPYGHYSIVMTEFPTGMEYPGIVFIGEQYFKGKFKDVLEQIIVHETAHQWWYGLVGSNQVKEAWLDEGLTTYSEVIYTNEVHGPKKGKKYLTDNIKIGYELGKNYLLEDDIVNKPLKDFSSWDDYGILVYTKAAMFINEINDKFGEDMLYRILREYFKEYKYYNATTDDFIKVCEEVTNTDFHDLVQKWLY